VVEEAFERVFSAMSSAVEASCELSKTSQ
jgi:hypothetical protein